MSNTATTLRIPENITKEDWVMLVLVISTQHMTFDDDKAIWENTEGAPYHCVDMKPGWMFKVSWMDDPESEASDDQDATDKMFSDIFIANIKKARELGYTHLRFDPDGIQHPDFTLAPPW
jgi:hypothetical protein